jgi:hypothetical protein
VKGRTVSRFVVPTVVIAVLALALLVGGAAGGKGKGHRGGHGNTNSGQTGYHFQVLNQVPGTPNRLLIQGSGTFNAHEAHGGGTYDHFMAGTGPPAAFGSTGTGAWRANDVVSWSPGLTHGVYQGGTLVIHATFYPVGKAPIPNVTIAVYCNLGPAGFTVSPPHAEGADVTVPGSPQLMFTQTPAGAGVPNTGITIFVVPKRDINVS